MNVDTLIESLSAEDLRAVLRSMSDDSSGTLDDLRSRVRGKYSSLQRICKDNDLRSDLSKDELIDEIMKSLAKPPRKKGLFGNFGMQYGGPQLMRWEMPGQRRRR